MKNSPTGLALVGKSESSNTKLYCHKYWLPVRITLAIPILLGGFLLLSPGQAKAAPLINQFVNGGFETGALSPWQVLPGGTTAIPGCNGTPTVAPRGPFISGSGSQLLQVNATSGGPVGGPGTGCATVDNFATIDPTETYLMFFQGTVMNLIIGDLVDLVLTNFNNAFQASLGAGHGAGFGAILSPGWCGWGITVCNGSTEFAFAVTGTGQDAGFLDSVFFAPVTASDLAIGITNGFFTLQIDPSTAINVPLDVFAPEPLSVGLFGVGLAVLGLVRRQRTI